MFLKFHGSPNSPQTFNYAEIIALNKSRPPTDQLELIPESGLLKHHCCFEKCPDYLVNQATESDKIFNRRHGLFAHFKWYFMPSHLYIPGFHVLFKSYAGKHRHLPPDEFVEA
ncbi:hypothetical protein HK100_003755, partial [Physocladia obscura]